MIDRLAPLVISLIIPRMDVSRTEIKRVPVIRPRLAHAPLLCPLAVDRAKRCGYGREGPDQDAQGRAAVVLVIVVPFSFPLH
jgi:hypothetical protein